MAQPNAAREPSMEEILASIRRIIESNEPVTGRPLTIDEDAEGDDAGHTPQMRGGIALQPQPAPAPRMPLPVDEPPARSFTPANSSEPLRAAAPAAEPLAGLTPIQTRAISLADVAARVRAASERNGLTPTPAAAELSEAAEAVAAPAADEPRMRSVELRGSTTAQQRPAMPVAAPEPVEAGMDIDTAAEPELQAAEDSVEDFEIDTGAAGPAAYDDEPVYHTDDFARSTGRESQAMALLSGEAEHLVARSFGELAEVLDMAQRRSLDEIAEEMLRPMLQEWLDDNLPTLVERLVREEIERVARGPRR